VALTVFRRRPQEDGTVKTDRMSPRVLEPRVTGRTLRFRTQAEMQYRPNLPKEKVEFDQVFELLGDGQGPGQGRLRQVWSSLEERTDVPPPPPPALLQRQR
jgi:hypothetical protein